MKNFMFLLITIAITSCTEQIERSPAEYSLYLKNESSSALTVKAFFMNDMVFEDVVMPGQLSERNFYVSEVFMGFRTWDSIVLKFENDKGFICTTHNDVNNSLCLPGRDNILLTTTDFVRASDNYYYVIKEQDLQNALVLE